VRTKSKEAHQAAQRSVLEVLSTRGLAGFTPERLVDLLWRSIAAAGDRMINAS
jgi:hypothetical protein